MAEHGIKETKEMMRFLIELAEGIDRSDADGKFDLADLGNMIGAMGAAAPAFSGAGDIFKEMGDLDEAEAQELVNYVESELQLGHERTLQLVKKAMHVGLGLYELMALMRK
jgi:hypothetical protein